MKEKRLPAATGSDLPVDFLKMVAEVFTTNFQEGLEALAKANAAQRFEADGTVYPDEIVLSVSLGQTNQISATTVHASSDFDPAASAPPAEDLLSANIDAIGAVFAQLFIPNNIDKLATGHLSELEGMPFEWTEIEINKRKIFIKIDKSNLTLDKMTDEWLSKNDPELARELKEEQGEEQKHLSERLNITPGSKHRKH
jgi:hypothetical protein